MHTDRNAHHQTERSERARSVAWIAAGAAVAGILVALSPTPATEHPHAGVRLIEQSAPAVPQQVAALGADVNWDAIAAVADPAPAAIAAYDH